MTKSAAHRTSAIAYYVPGLRDSVAASGVLVVQPTPSALADALAQHLSRLATGKAPTVNPDGVIPWSEVMSEILKVAATERDTDLRLSSPSISFGRP